MPLGWKGLLFSFFFKPFFFSHLYINVTVHTSTVLRRNIIFFIYLLYQRCRPHSKCCHAFQCRFSRLLELNPAPLSLFLCVSHRQLYNHKHTLEKHTLIVLKWGLLFLAQNLVAGRAQITELLYKVHYLFIVVPII